MEKQFRIVRAASSRCPKCGGTQCQMPATQASAKPLVSPVSATQTPVPPPPDFVTYVKEHRRADHR